MRRSEMANSQYHRLKRRQFRGRQALMVLFGVPGAAMVALALYMGVYLGDPHALLEPMTLPFLLVIWIVLFGLTAKALKVMAPSAGKRSAPEVAAQASGVRGELGVKSWLGALPGDYILFDNVRISHAQSRTGERELDFVVIGKRRVFVVEVKNNAGTIAPDDLWDKQWPVTTPSGGQRSMRNPMHQVYGQRKTLEERLAERGVHVQVQPIVVLSNPNCLFLWGENTPIPIAQSGKVLRGLITRLDERGRRLDPPRVAEALASVDRTRQPA
ncbi:hypothetical protein A6K26_007835 [Gammaproteobacteria bacterium 2W06]|nr:hypothetical protein A6K26_007835 [Gammaproteobacteria bacterium 2W06]